jgi:Protein of unknown function (DUF3617)
VIHGISRTALLSAALAIAASASGQAQQSRAGLWQFTSQGDMAASPGVSTASGSQTQISGSFTNCIDPARSIPLDPHLSCQINGINRRGAAVTWATTCSMPQGTFQSQGVAQYSGDTMTGTLTTYVPMLNGQITQRISGRYVGPCSR